MEINVNFSQGYAHFYSTSYSANTEFTELTKKKKRQLHIFLIFIFKCTGRFNECFKASTHILQENFTNFLRTVSDKYEETTNPTGYEHDPYSISRKSFF